MTNIGADLARPGERDTTELPFEIDINLKSGQMRLLLEMQGRRARFDGSIDFFAGVASELLHGGKIVLFDPCGGKQILLEGQVATAIAEEIAKVICDGGLAAAEPAGRA